MKNKNSQSEKAYVYVIKNPSYNDICLCAWESVLYPGTPVVYDTRFGLDLGVVVGPAPVEGRTYVPGSRDVAGASIVFGDSEDLPETCDCHRVHGRAEAAPNFLEPQLVNVSGDVEWIDHLATPSEMAKYEENTAKEEDALRVCREKVLKHRLNMKLVTSHFLLGEPKVIFFFTAEERVDFRNLVKDLVGVFRMRIELRQIGVRDESRLIGGLSVCGRDYCCHCITSQLEPVTIKMAKEQNLSLNSMKISGPCGRLLCCLAYEYDYYVEEKAGCPPEGTRLKIGRDLWKVTEVNILSRKLTILGGEGRVAYIPAEEVSFNDETHFWEVSEEFQEEFLQ